MNALEGIYDEALTARATVNSDLRTARANGAITGEIDTAERRQGIAAAEQEVEDRQTEHSAIEREANASRSHRTAQEYDRIVNVLGPGGVRASMIAKGLGRMNAGLSSLADAAKWPQVAIAENGSITYGSAVDGAARPAALCSESARWRIQAMMQLTVAALTKSSAVVLDRADLLDRANRDGLIRAVKRVTAKCPVAVLLCTTGEPAADAPWRQVRIADGRLVK